jgi:hypothetical protein
MIKYNLSKAAEILDRDKNRLTMTLNYYLNISSITTNEILELEKNSNLNHTFYDMIYAHNII